MSIRHRILARAERAIERTPDWVFVVVPQLFGPMLLGAAMLIGLSVIMGTSLNPLTNMRDALAIMKSGHQPSQPD